MEEDIKRDIVNYRRQKACDLMHDVDVLIDNELWNSAVNRMYYACFHMVSALLILHGIEVKSHMGVRQAFGLHFVKTNLLSSECGRIFSKIYDKRQSSDYDDFPLGISFFTFKLISYVIEVHRRHIEPCRNLVAFATYIGFFPTILSGPIDRPKQFLGQLSHSRTFDYAMVVDGSRQILWGMFKKMVIADNLAMITSGAWGCLLYTSDAADE